MRCSTEIQKIYSYMYAYIHMYLCMYAYVHMYILYIDTHSGSGLELLNFKRLEA